MSRVLCLVLLLAVISTSGCAMLNRDNLRVFNWTERNLVPEDPTLQILMAPILIPAGILAVVIDQVFIHPFSVVDDAAKDVFNALLWPKWTGHYLQRCATMPWVAVLSPVVFIFDLLIRSLFDVETNNMYRYVNPRDKILAQQLKEGKFD